MEIMISTGLSFTCCSKNHGKCIHGCVDVYFWKTFVLVLNSTVKKNVSFETKLAFMLMINNRPC